MGVNGIYLIEARPSGRQSGPCVPASGRELRSWCDLEAPYPQMMKVTPGVWFWKDDTNTLEFASFAPAPDAKEKLKKGKAIHFQEMSTKTADRSTPTMFQELFGAKFPEKRLKSVEEISPRLSKRGQKEYVTLDDVKYAALFLVQENESYHISSFTTIMRSRQLDEFLMALLYYLSYFLEKITLEKKPKSLMGRKTSSSQKDREFFECFYNFCTYVAWVAFRRKHFQEIQEEIGRLLRSDVFNPALKEKRYPGVQWSTEASADQRKVLFPYDRSLYARRPAIMSVVGQRSPVLSTLLPLPRDSAQYLFQNHYLHRGRTAPASKSKDHLDVTAVVFTPKVGIIGALRSKFNRHTLMPIGGMEEEDEEEEDEEEERSMQSSSSVYSYNLMSSSYRGVLSGCSRQSIILSRTTTEGDYSENG
ncbi:protein phosphatase 1 regulatory subunit 36 isoform X4 [Alligator mississippiensis]|uniref:protein phosphatase 1 regulatory subunit 36 isoform X4 n=1 Tax=Alligator mississippiensis TaxID=8496 RepID=UPI0009076056|nr:protein phosphatase 1 regulatory subunit 36 isoform X4 [Alligator mississippiensis]